MSYIPYYAPIHFNFSLFWILTSQTTLHHVPLYTPSYMHLYVIFIDYQHRFTYSLHKLFHWSKQHPNWHISRSWKLWKLGPQKSFNFLNQNLSLYILSLLHTILVFGIFIINVNFYFNMQCYKSQGICYMKQIKLWVHTKVYK